MIIEKQQSLLRSTSLVSLMTFLSRLFGFVRDMVLAHLFGATGGMDAFLVAFRIPNFMRRLFAEGAFAQAFVPVLTEYQQTQTPDKIRNFIAQVSGHLTAVLSLVTLIGILAAPIILLIFAPGFGKEGLRTVLATKMLQLTFPYLMLISLTAMAGSILNTYGYFGVPAITPILLNITMIAAAWYLTPYFTYPIIAIAWGVLIAGIIQLLFQLPFLYQKKLLILPALTKKEEGVKKVLRLMVPALFGVSVAQINLMIDSIFASFLTVGSVSWLYYTDRLTEFPLGIFGAAIATVILPTLAKRYSQNNPLAYSAALDWAMRLVLLLALPSAVGLVGLSLPLIATCFAYGKFNLVDLLQTQKSLIALSIGIPAFMMVKILASAFYARQDIKTPVKTGVWTMIINSAICALLIVPLAHSGLALASSLASYTNCCLLMYFLIKRQIFIVLPGWKSFLGKLLLANLILGFYLYHINKDPLAWLGYSAGLRAMILIKDIVIALVIYFFSLRIMGIKLNDFRKNIREFS